MISSWRKKFASEHAPGTQWGREKLTRGKCDNLNLVRHKIHFDMILNPDLQLPCILFSPWRFQYIAVPRILGNYAGLPEQALQGKVA